MMSSNSISFDIQVNAKVDLRVLARTEIKNTEYVYLFSFKHKMMMIWTKVNANSENEYETSGGTYPFKISEDGVRYFDGQRWALMEDEVQRAFSDLEAEKQYNYRKEYQDKIYISKFLKSLCNVGIKFIELEKVNMVTSIRHTRNMMFSFKKLDIFNDNTDPVLTPLVEAKNFVTRRPSFRLRRYMV